MESSNYSCPVEIKELKENGLSDEPIRFASYVELDNFLHRGDGYISYIVKKSQQGQRKAKYVAISPSFEYGRQVNRKYYIITKINGEKVTDFDDVKAFYLSHPSYQIRPKKSKEQLHFEKERRRHLLLAIDVKYGGIDKAEGTPELEELRKLVGAYKIENN